MNVRRGIALTLWTVLLTICFTVTLFIVAFQGSVMNAEFAKKTLAQSSAYENVLDQVVTDQILGGINEKYPDNQFIDRQMIEGSLGDVFPENERRELFEPAIDTTFAWLNGERADLRFTLPVDNKIEQFFGALEPRVAAKVESLPVCSDSTLEPIQAVLAEQCVPSYAPRSSVTESLMSALLGNRESLDASLKRVSSVDVPAEGRGFDQVRRSVEYLDIAKWIALALSVLFAGIVIARRRSLGLVAAGLALMLTGFNLWLTTPLLESVTSLSGAEVTSIVFDQLLSNVASHIATIAAITSLAGAVIVALTLLKRRAGKGVKPHA